MNINSVDLRQLRYFVAVAEELHFGRAARRLHISQPPLSQQIMTLESNLGVQLLIRNNRRVSLTESGKYLLRAAQDILREVHQAAEHTRMVSLGAIGRIRIGVHFSVPLHPFVGLMLQRFRAVNPQIRLEITLHDKPDQTQLTDIENGLFDIGLIWLNRNQRSARTQCHDLVFNPLQAYIPAGHELSNLPAIAAKDLAEAHLVGPVRGVGSQLHEAIMQFVGASGADSNILYEAQQMPIMLNMVAAGQGVALLPDFLQRLNLPGVVARPLDFGSRKPVGMMLNLLARTSDSDAAQAGFIRMATEYARIYQNAPRDASGNLLPEADLFAAPGTN